MTLGFRGKRIAVFAFDTPSLYYVWHGLQIRASEVLDLNVFALYN